MRYGRAARAARERLVGLNSDTIEISREIPVRGSLKSDSTSVDDGSCTSYIVMSTLSEVEHGPSEAAPLLPQVIPTANSQTKSTQASRERPSQLRILAILFLFVLFLDLGLELIQPAQTRAFEAIYCKGYYKKHEPGLIGSDGKDGVDEKWCKVGVIQGEVAILKGWQITIDSVGSTRL